MIWETKTLAICLEVQNWKKDEENNDVILCVRIVLAY